MSKVHADATITVHVPMNLAKRGARKLILAPAGAEAWAPVRARIDNTMIKALARAHRWKQCLESGQYASISDLAKVERINQSYLCRVLRMTLLAPDIVEMILDGRQPPTLQLSNLLKPFPIGWDEQRARWGIGKRD